MEAKGSERSREGATLKSKNQLKRKNVNPPRGHDFLVWRWCQGLDKVGKG
jgi:hypothetical protein